MRIVKLSTNPPTGFATLDDVRQFFLTDIGQRTPPGRFDVTPGRIAPEKLDLGEALVFTYQARVVFTARAGSGLIQNEDERRQTYPWYFAVDLATLHEADEDFHAVERQYSEAMGADYNLADNQGWNWLPDSVHTESLWARLGGSNDADLLPSAEDADDDEPNHGEVYIPDGVDRRPIVAQQIRQRRGQRRFRDALLRRYGDRCQITGCEALAVLEAAHIHPYRGETDHHIENGLLLRSDVHTLFDLNLVGIEPESLQVQLHPDLTNEYRPLANITLRCAGDHRPSQEALGWRYQRFLQRVHRPI